MARLILSRNNCLRELNSVSDSASTSEFVMKAK